MLYDIDRRVCYEIDANRRVCSICLAEYNSFNEYLEETCPYIVKYIGETPADLEKIDNWIGNNLKYIWGRRDLIPINKEKHYSYYYFAKQDDATLFATFWL